MIEKTSLSADETSNQHNQMLQYAITVSAHYLFFPNFFNKITFYFDDDDDDDDDGDDDDKDELLLQND